MARADGAAELTEEAEVVGEDDLLVIGKGVSQEDFDDLHPVAHVETDEEVVEDEELEIGFVQIDKRGGETDGQRKLRQLSFIQIALWSSDNLARDLDAKLNDGNREFEVRLYCSPEATATW